MSHDVVSHVMAEQSGVEPCRAIVFSSTASSTEMVIDGDGAISTSVCARATVGQGVLREIAQKRLRVDESRVNSI